MPTHQKFDVHQEITNRIIDALESAGECRLPWIRNKGGTMLRPANVASRKPYNGVNIVSLWVSALAANYPSNLWGTYRQWQERGCQVRKGEKSSLIVFYKTIDIEQCNEQTGETEPGERMFARASWVFNAAQVEGFEPERDDIPDEIAFDPIARAEGFARANPDSPYKVVMKKLTAGDISAGTVTWAVATGSPSQVEKRRAMSIFRPSSAITTIGNSTWVQAWTTGNPAAQTIPANNYSAPAIAFAYTHTSNGSAVWTTFSPAQDQTVIVEDATSSFEFRFKIFNSGPQSTSADVGDGGNNNLLYSGVIYVQ